MQSTRSKNPKTEASCTGRRLLPVCDLKRGTLALHACAACILLSELVHQLCQAGYGLLHHSGCASLQTTRSRRRKTSATSLSLFVRWYNPSGKTKVSHLALKPIETVDALQVISNLLLWPLACDMHVIMLEPNLHLQPSDAMHSHTQAAMLLLLW